MEAMRAIAASSRAPADEWTGSLPRRCPWRRRASAHAIARRAADRDATTRGGCLMPRRVTSGTAPA